MSVREVKYGNQPDGSLLLGPESSKALAAAMLRLSNSEWGIRADTLPAIFVLKMREFSAIAWKECRIEFEVFT